MAIKIKHGWSEEEINNLELTFLHEMFDCSNNLGVDATITYARYLSENIKLNPDNYPVFMLLLESGNHWVIDALVGKNNPEEFFKLVQPNSFLLSECFKVLIGWKRGTIYAKSLLVLFGLLKVAYESPHEGYRMYPLTITELNNLGKHLDEKKDQKDPVNRTILSLLDKISQLVDPGKDVEDPQVLKIATQANNIRGKFLDSTKSLNEAIPDLLLEKGKKEDEIPPSGSAKQKIEE
jgi:hypothetical protein